MSLAIDLHRGLDPATDRIGEWLRARGWKGVTVGRNHLWQHSRLRRGDLCDITEALILTAMREQEEGQSFLGWFDDDGELRDRPKRSTSRRQRLSGDPTDDEDLFRG